MMNEFKKDDRVCYEVKHSKERRWGTVSSINDEYVFVKFDEQVSNLGWEGTTSQACRPEQLIKE